MDGVQLPPKAIESLQGDSLLFTTKRWKIESTLEPPSGFEHGTSELGVQRLNH